MASFIIILIFTSFIRKKLNVQVSHPSLSQLLYIVRILAIVLFVADFSIPKKFDPTVHFFYSCLLACVVYTLWQIREDRIANTLLIAVAPYFVVVSVTNIIEWATPKFYDSIDDYFQFGLVVVVIWLIAYGIGANNQQKALRIEEEKNKLVTVEKDQLEEMVAERTSEILLQKNELQKTIVQLKATQAQLVQSEKLASLGELTAGIAHEIQNPLNFVNNFSELSDELVGEILEERSKAIGDRDAGLEEELLTDLKANLEKINHHGKRASGIVKSMLEHSRMSTGEKAPTDVNDLADEYLRLAYHGLRAKDRTFNAKMDTHFDENVPKITVVSQDIGRVFLNIINNAFQAPPPENAPVDYMKHVIVKTITKGKNVVIEISDNGRGIPDELMSKVFQPFFTTKKAGEGTGLGLSLAYDIITKGHGGGIKVSSKKNVGTEFVITLPIDPLKVTSTNV